MGINRTTGSLMLRDCWLGAQPGRVLEDALRAGVVDELFAADETLFHRHLAPGAVAIGEFGQGCIRGRVHVRHSLRGLQTLSTECAAATRPRLKSFLATHRASLKNRGIVQTTITQFTCL